LAVSDSVRTLDGGGVEIDDAEADAIHHWRDGEILAIFLLKSTRFDGRTPMRLKLASVALTFGMFAPAAHAAFLASRIVGWAAVDGGNAVVLNGKNVTGATHPALGNYTVTFSRPVIDCAISLTVLEATGSVLAVRFDPTHPKTAIVRSTFAQSFADNSFHIVAIC
jgi:hypothetical protein